jgi:predicted nucleic acid-binding protein
VPPMSGSGKMPPPEPIVSNSGPLITLATIGMLDLLEALFKRIVIPQAVYDEVVVYGAGDPGSDEISAAQWIRTLQVRDQLAVNLLRETLGAGESEAIVLAQELNGGYVLLDDALARRKAEHIGLRLTGTLGILVMAKEAGLILAVKPVLDELRLTDFRMSDRVYQDVLSKAGEA